MTFYVINLRRFHIVCKKNDIVIACLIARGFQSINIHMRNFDILINFVYSGIHFDKYL